MSEVRYSLLKAMKFPDRLATIRGDAEAGPVHVQIILSDLCNQACHFCAYRDPTYTSSVLFHVEHNYNPNRMLAVEKVMEILDDCVEMGVRAVQFTGGGEPTIHPKFQFIVNTASRLGLKWALVTNGVMHQHDLSEAAWIRVSLDAGCEETYMRIRRCPKGHFQRALKTIEKNRCGVGFVITPENWSEVYTAAALAKNSGASNIRIGAQFSTENEHLFDSFAPGAAELCRQAEDLTDRHFTVHNRFSEKLGDLVQANPDYSQCGYQYFTTYIGADENLYRCCVYAYNPHGLIASIKGRRFRDVWREAALPDFRRFDAQGCERCQFNTINKHILEVTTPDASEVFV
jgi:MoaA/NifB/PqqE/SkfB family radical SAM enzyme